MSVKNRFRLMSACLFWMSSVAVLALAGCASNETSSPNSAEVMVTDPSQVHWEWQQNAIQMTFSATPDLNYINGQPHALMLCFYQLKSKASFDDLLKQPNGAARLRQCNNFDQSVVYHQRVFVQPGESVQLDLPRYLGVKSVGLVAGYNNSMSEEVSRSIDIPIDKLSKGLIWRTDYYQPGILRTHLLLARHSIETSMTESALGKTRSTDKEHH
ncbi:type VI secretion system lipoprotein TssJ [Vibrio profundum]|uniref:type VI secretion system lipoprotein TssJ n=1 Tax=Vibrio profundum TaxID=2910247 RepID=UPI003D0B4CF6